jgi:hypothetical protein
MHWAAWSVCWMPSWRCIFRSCSRNILKGYSLITSFNCGVSNHGRTVWHMQRGLSVFGMKKLEEGAGRAWVPCSRCRVLLEIFCSPNSSSPAVAGWSRLRVLFCSLRVDVKRVQSKFSYSHVSRRNDCVLKFDLTPFRRHLFAQIHPPQTLRYNDSSVLALKDFGQTTFWRKHRMTIAPPTPRVRPVF